MKFLNNIVFEINHSESLSLELSLSYFFCFLWFLVFLDLVGFFWAFLTPISKSSSEEVSSSAIWENLDCFGPDLVSLMMVSTLAAATGLNASFLASSLAAALSSKAFALAKNPFAGASASA